LIGPLETAIYFDATTDEAWRARSSRFEGLSRAAAVGICVANPAAYLARYAAPDKASSGLGTNAEDWPVPFWFGDAGASTMAALLLAEELGLAAAFLGCFRGESELKSALDIPESYRVYGAILLGRPDGGDHRSSSLDRPGPSRSQRLHRGGLHDDG
jgi:nitroreductase